MPDRMPEGMSDRMSGYMPERMSDRMSEYIYIYFQTVCQKLYQNCVSGRGSLEVKYVFFVANLCAMRHFGTGQSLHDASGKVVATIMP